MTVGIPVETTRLPTLDHVSPMQHERPTGISARQRSESPLQRSREGDSARARVLRTSDVLCIAHVGACSPAILYLMFLSSWG
jgi:hypothetical protein